MRGRSTSCILATEESKNAEGRGHRSSIITACGGRRGVKWRRRDSFRMKAGVGAVGGVGGVGGVGWVGTCVAPLITHIMLLRSSVIASRFCFS